MNNTSNIFYLLEKKQSMKLHDKKRDYLDKEVFNLVSLIESSEIAPVEKIDYVLDDNVIDLSDKFNGVMTTKELLKSQVVSVKNSDGKICRELRGENYQKYLKFTNEIYKVTEINQSVSKDFILDLILNYIIESHKQRKTEGNFSDYLIDCVENEVKEYKVYFTIHNIELFEALQIGRVKLSRLERDVMTQDEKHDAKTVRDFYNQYKRNFYASCTIKAEKQKAIEIAFKECSLAIDLLKICSDTMDDPLSRLSFDIDSRVSETLSSQVLIKNKKDNDFSITKRRLPAFHQINDAYIYRLNHRNLQFFISFLSSLPSEQNELQKILINAIRRFGKALSNYNLNQRIVELFTIMESLVVPNAQANILESLTRYCSKLIHKNREDRTRLIRLIKNMYSIRSSYVHHAIEIDFEIDDLSELQISVQNLIGRLIEKSREHTNKASILKEIDDAILDAY